MSENSVKTLKSIDGKCKNCGHNFKFSPKHNALVCEKCSSSKRITGVTKLTLHDPDSVNDNDLLEWQGTEKKIKCKSCGADIQLKNNEISTYCKYCESQNVVLKDSIKGLYPDTIIPFQLDISEANQKFVEEVKKKFWCPKKFKKSLSPQNITGFYFPSFNFCAKSYSTYKGTLFSEYTDKDGHSHRNYFPISGNKTVNHENVLVESSSKLTQLQLNGILPYNYNSKVGFNPEFLFGYEVEQYNEQFRVSYGRSKEIMLQQIRKEILKGYNYDGVDYLNITPSYSDKNFEYVLMPTYAFEYQYKKKKYTTFMNGQTGKIGKESLPFSKLKLGLLIGTIIGIILLIAFLL